MKVYLDENIGYFKANLHTHSTLSDGRASVEEIKEKYMEHGYSIVAFTDHEHIVDNSHLSDDSFLAITGCELGISEMLADDGKVRPDWGPETKQYFRTVHVNLLALDPHNTLTPYADMAHDKFGPDEVREAASYDNQREKRIYSCEGISDLVREAHERGFLVSLNHPSWSLIDSEQYLHYEGFDFIEICNTGCYKSGHPKDETAYDTMLKNGKRIFCTAADDNHNAHGFDDPRSDSFGGWCMINAEELDYDRIMNALKRGDFYASTGPEIYSLTREGDKVTVKCSPVKHIYKQTEGRAASGKHADGELLTRATFKLSPYEKIFRIRIEDEHGECAYTQPYDVEFD